jgi:hypothetical protein
MCRLYTSTLYLCLGAVFSTGNKNHVVAEYADDHPAAAVDGAAIYSVSPFDAPSTVDGGLPVLHDDHTAMGETEADVELVASVIRTAGKAEAESGVFA